MPKMIVTDFHEKLVIYFMMATRQLTKLSDTFFHIIRLYTRESHNAENHLNGYRAYAQTEIADIITQLKKMCLALNISFDKTCEMADKRDKEKEAEFKRKYPNDPWV